MRKQIAAANWKMNLTCQQGEKLLEDILKADSKLADHQQVIFGVPFPYLTMAARAISGKSGYDVAAQNCSDKKKRCFYR